MKRLILASLFMSFFLVSYASAYPVDVVSVNGPQDPLFVQGWVDEFGDGFPTDELITSTYIALTNDTACWDGSDDPDIFNVIVEITNLTERTVPLWYVADPGTTISNFDGFIGNAGMGDLMPAFRIDRAGINAPLIYESITANDLFEPGETWWFIIQDYGNAAGGPPAPFGSLGIASISAGVATSTGSLITPEPATVCLLGLGALSLLRKRRA